MDKEIHWTISHSQQERVSKLMEQMEWALDNRVEDLYFRCFEELRSLGMPDVETGDHLRVHVLPSTQVGYESGKRFILTKRKD